MTAHKHAEQMALFAQDAKETENPSTRWEFRVSDSAGRLTTKWISCGARNPEWRLEHEYRRKPRPVETYHVIFRDGSMSAGYADLATLNEKRMKYVTPQVYGTFHKVRVTRLEDKPVKIEVVE